ncbi:hypothetical protein E4U12_005798 [Claviceps purpurea]|nr:hypothetical protein E4U12_005798 [Claviceps purpurea]
MPASEQQMVREPAPVAVSAEQPRPVEPMSVDSMRLRGGGEGEYRKDNDVGVGAAKPMRMRAQSKPS